MSTGSAPAPRRSQPPSRTSGRGVKALLEEQVDKLAAVMPKGLTPAKQIQIVSTLLYRTPKLQECAPATIVAAVMEASELGLSFSRTLGEAYLVPYFNSKAGVTECQMQPGYRGLTKLARQSGEIAYIQGRLVREGEPFQYRYTPDLEFLHEPYAGGSPQPPVIGAYAIAKLLNGEYLLEFMTTDEIESVHHRSQSYRNALRYNKPEEGPWVDFWGEQAKKTAVKRLAKMLPVSEERFWQAVEADDRQYEHGAEDVTSRRPGQTKSQALAQRLRGELPRPEPEFSASEGVREPLRSESSDEDYGSHDAMEEEQGRHEGAGDV